MNEEKNLVQLQRALGLTEKKERKNGKITLFADNLAEIIKLFKKNEESGGRLCSRASKEKARLGELPESVYILRPAKGNCRVESTTVHLGHFALGFVVVVSGWLSTEHASFPSLRGLKLLKLNLVPHFLRMIQEKKKTFL